MFLNYLLLLYMIKFIQTTYADLPGTIIDDEVSQIKNKCKLTGTVVDIKRELWSDKCVSNLEIIVQADHQYYKFFGIWTWTEQCTFDSIYEVFMSSPKIWKNIYIISDSDSHIISHSLSRYAKYSEKKCESNFSKQQYILEYQNNSYKMSSDSVFYSILIWVIFFVFLFIFFIKYFKKQKNKTL